MSVFDRAEAEPVAGQHSDPGARPRRQRRRGGAGRRRAAARAGRRLLVRRRRLGRHLTPLRAAPAPARAVAPPPPRRERARRGAGCVCVCGRARAGCRAPGAANTRSTGPLCQRTLQYLCIHL